jgi:hypothetical protein
MVTNKSTMVMREEADKTTWWPLMTREATEACHQTNMARFMLWSPLVISKATWTEVRILEQVAITLELIMELEDDETI